MSHHSTDTDTGSLHGAHNTTHTSMTVEQYRQGSMVNLQNIPRYSHQEGYIAVAPAGLTNGLPFYGVATQSHQDSCSVHGFHNRQTSVCKY